MAATLRGWFGGVIASSTREWDFGQSGR
jgi:hypothetical protein